MIRLTKEQRRRVWRFILAKVLFYLGWPFFALRAVCVRAVRNLRFYQAKEQAIYDSAIHHGAKRYVIAVGNHYHVVNRQQLLKIHNQWQKEHPGEERDFRFWALFETK